MKKAISVLLSAALALGLLAGCGQSPSSVPQSGSTPASGSETAAESVTIKIWHDGDEAIMQTIADTVNSQLSGDNITVTFEKKTGLSDQLKLYGSDAANGPDMYFYAHDSLGTFVAMDILAPLSEVAGADVLADALPMTVEAGQIGGEQYFLPVYFETLVFLYNKALWQGDIPTTTEDLYAYMQANTDTAAGTYAVVNQHSTAYNVSPFINGFGGYILNEEGQPGLNDPKTIEGVEYNKKFAALQADGDYNTVTTLFNEGKAAAIIGGAVAGLRHPGRGHRFWRGLPVRHDAAQRQPAGALRRCAGSRCAEDRRRGAPRGHRQGAGGTGLPRGGGGAGQVLRLRPCQQQGL